MRLARGPERTDAFCALHRAFVWIYCRVNPSGCNIDRCQHLLQLALLRLTCRAFFMKGESRTHLDTPCRGLDFLIKTRAKFHVKFLLPERLRTLVATPPFESTAAVALCCSDGITHAVKDIHESAQERSGQGVTHLCSAGPIKARLSSPITHLKSRLRP